MNLKKFSFLLMFSGVSILALSVMWFLLAFAETMDFVGEYGGSDISAEMLTCLYSSSPICQGASFLSEGPSYSPVVFWIGVVALLGGVIIRLSLAKSIYIEAPTAINDSAAADGNLLGFIPEQKYTRIIYILMLTSAVGGLFLLPLMIAGFAGFILGLMGLSTLKARLNDQDRNHLAAICVVFAVTILLFLLSVGSFLFLLIGLAQIVLFYIGFNSYREGRSVSFSNLKSEAQLAKKSIFKRFSGHEQN